MLGLWWRTLDNSVGKREASRKQPPKLKEQLKSKKEMRFISTIAFHATSRILPIQLL
jgi:hypothetical protein